MMTAPQRGLRLVVLVAAVNACAHFEPTVPVRSRTADVSLELAELVAGGRSELVYRSQTTLPHAIRRGWLTVPSRVPCSGGAEATEIAIDGLASSDGVLAPGAHDVRVRLEGAGHFTLDTVIDLELEQGLCVRAPAVSQSLPFEASNRLMLVTAVNLDGNADLAGMRAIYGFQVGLGKWLGPILLTGQAGIGGASCNEGTCGATGKNDSLKSGLAFPLSVDARYAIPLGTLNLLTNYALVGARYAFTSVTLPTLAGDHHFGVHGFYGVLSWAYVGAIRGPFRHVERGPLFELDVPIGVIVAPELGTNRAAWSAGFDMRFFLPL